jgi:hypothetical protein
LATLGKYLKYIIPVVICYCYCKLFI